MFDGIHARHNIGFKGANARVESSDLCAQIGGNSLQIRQTLGDGRINHCFAAARLCCSQSSLDLICQIRDICLFGL